jgi:hypothetical protein
VALDSRAPIPSGEDRSLPSPWSQFRGRVPSPHTAMANLLPEAPAAETAPHGLPVRKSAGKTMASVFVVKSSMLESE